MTIVSLNLGNFGSTGKIITGIAEKAEEIGIKTLQAYPETPNNISPKQDDIIICTDLYRRVNQRLAYYTGYVGCFSVSATKKLIRKIDEIKPDILHLHNIHHSYLNHKMLFDYIRMNRIKIVWTLHDCWAFTGQCPHFTFVNCDAWKTACSNCPQIDKYPATRVDHTNKMWAKKKEWFTNLANVTIVTPSVWLAELVGQSFLKEYPVRVINNGIDLNVFKPSKSQFRNHLSISSDKIIILGISFEWDYRKGLDIFLDLHQKLDERFVIVLVGTTVEIDKQLPEGIISIHRTSNQHELAEIYTAADIFINPTREDNYPTVNMEAIACGTPVITFNTGGSPEIITPETGMVTKKNTADSMLEAIYQLIPRLGDDMTKACLLHAQSFEKNERFKEYIELYKEMFLSKVDYTTF